MYAINPQIKIEILQFAESKPVEFPADLVSNITSTRSLKGNSMSISLPGHIDMETVNKYFPDQAVISLQVKLDDEYIQENLGFVRQVSINAHPSGRTTTEISIEGIESRLARNELFLDLQDNTAVTSLDKASKVKNAFEGSYSKYANVLKETKDLSKLIEGIYENLIRDLANTSKTSSGGQYAFGGRDLFASKSDTPLDQKSVIYPLISSESYTGNITHVLNFLSTFKIGQNVNFWNLLFSLVTEPLYELYVDTLESSRRDYVYITPSKQEPLWSKTAYIVFRKTPFERIFGIDGKWNPEIEKIETIPADVIKSIKFISDSTRVVSGVHIGLKILDQMQNTLIFKPKWNDKLRARYGYKLLNIMLDGLTLNKLTDAQIFGSAGIQGTLTAIRDRLYNIFCSDDLKHSEIVLDLPYNFYRVGEPYKINHVLDGFGTFGYLETITNSFNPRGRIANSNCSFKWVSRTAQDFDSAITIPNFVQNTSTIV
jgi:hypothetical protein